MDRRKFMKMLGMAPAVPIAMKVSDLTAEIIEPRIIQKTNSGIVIANHLPEGVLKHVSTENESIIGYQISQQAEYATNDPGLLSFPNITGHHTMIEIEIYGRDQSELIHIQAGEPIYLLLDMPADSHHMGIYQEFKVLCTGKDIYAHVDDMFRGKFTFEEIV